MVQIEPFIPVTTAKTWGEEVLVAWAPAGGMLRAGYTGKVLRRLVTGQRGGLQYHRIKDETFYLLEGEVLVYYVDNDGVLRRQKMWPGMSYHVPPGAIHSVQTLTDSVMLEVSNDVFDDRVRVEEQYSAQMAALGAKTAAPAIPGAAPLEPVEPTNREEEEP